MNDLTTHHDNTNKGQWYKHTCSGYALGPILRGNSVKHTAKHTKRAHKHTMYHLAHQGKWRTNISCTRGWVRDTHNEYSWVRMGANGCGGTYTRSRTREWEKTSRGWLLSVVCELAHDRKTTKYNIIGTGGAKTVRGLLGAPLTPQRPNKTSKTSQRGKQRSNKPKRPQPKSTGGRANVSQSITSNMSTNRERNPKKNTRKTQNNSQALPQPKYKLKAKERE